MNREHAPDGDSRDSYNNENGLLGLQNGLQRPEWNSADFLSVRIRDPGVNSTNSYRKYQSFRHRDQRIFYMLDR